MLFADVDWTAFFSAATAFLVVVTAVIQGKWLQRKNNRVGAQVESAAAEAKTAARTAQAQAEATTQEITAVHSTLNGTGILGTLRAVAEKQDRQGEWMAAHAAEDKEHFANNDRKLDEVIREVRETRMKAAVVAGAIQQGVVIPPAPEAR